MTKAQHIPDEGTAALLQSLVGKTVLRVEALDCSGGEEWTENEAYVLTFTDGTRVLFSSYGYDNWGAQVGPVPEQEYGDVVATYA